jgi:hypothetical protein
MNHQREKKRNNNDAKVRSTENRRRSQVSKSLYETELRFTSHDAPVHNTSHPWLPCTPHALWHHSFLCSTPRNHRRFFLCPLLYSTKCASNDKRQKEPSEACPTLQKEKFLVGFNLFLKARKLGRKNTNVFKQRRRTLRLVRKKSKASMAWRGAPSLLPQRKLETRQEGGRRRRQPGGDNTRRLLSSPYHLSDPAVTISSSISSDGRAFARDPIPSFCVKERKKTSADRPLASFSQSG